tara:strand:- start:915 stop:1142 length:228 start_codon:yes stop_codon:yes gene_type:complete
MFLKNQVDHKNFYFPTTTQLNILNEKNIVKILNKFKPSIVIHLPSFSILMNIYEKEVNNSIDINTIGTANIVKVC